MGRILILLYGVVAYLAFFVAILYAIGFVGNIGVPKTIDSGVQGSVATAVIINVLGLFVFAVQHTIMARPAFKKWWTKIIPEAMERSTFVLLSSVILLGIFWAWRPIGGILWSFDGSAARSLMWTLYFAGWVIVFYSSFLIDHFDLFGLRQVFLNWKNKPYSHAPFKKTSLYKVVRHPLMLGFLMTSWFTPTMTYGHLLYAAVITGYILFGTRMEEKDLLDHLGDDYASYQKDTPMLIPVPKKKADPSLTTEKA